MVCLTESRRRPREYTVHPDDCAVPQRSYHSALGVMAGSATAAGSFTYFVCMPQLPRCLQSRREEKLSPSTRCSPSFSHSFWPLSSSGGGDRFSLLIGQSIHDIRRHLLEIVPLFSLLQVLALVVFTLARLVVCSSLWFMRIVSSFRKSARFWISLIWRVLLVGSQIVVNYIFSLMHSFQLWQTTTRLSLNPRSRSRC